MKPPSLEDGFDCCITQAVYPRRPEHAILGSRTRTSFRWPRQQRLALCGVVVVFESIRPRPDGALFENGQRPTRRPALWHWRSPSVRTIRPSNIDIASQAPSLNPAFCPHPRRRLGDVEGVGFFPDTLTVAAAASFAAIPVFR